MPLMSMARRSVWTLLVTSLFWTPANAQNLTGDEILRRCVETYRSLSTYSGSTAVISEMVFGDSIITRSSTAEIYFASPGRYRISGRGATGGAYQVSGDSARSRVWIEYPSPEHAAALRGFLGGRVEGDTLVMDSLSAEVAVAAVSGIGNRAPFYISALLGLVRGIPLEKRTPGRLLREEPCGAGTCFVVLLEEPTMRATYWVDSTSFLLRRLKQEQTSAEWAATVDEVRDSDSGGAVAPLLDLATDHIAASTFLVVFSNIRVDEPLEDHHFGASRAQ